jgi:hypothetical protein
MKLEHLADTITAAHTQLEAHLTAALTPEQLQQLDALVNAVCALNEGDDEEDAHLEPHDGVSALRHTMVEDLLPM